MVDETTALGEEAISLVELLGDLCVEPDHLHGADLEAGGEDCVDDFACLTLFDDVGFDDAQGAVLFVWF